MTLLLDTTDVQPADAARRVNLVGTVLVLAATVLLWAHWRLARERSVAWLILGMSAMSVHLLTMAALAAVEPARVVDRPGMMLVTRTVMAVGLLVLLLLSSRSLRVDPLLLGTALGVALFVGRYAALVLTPHLNLSLHQLHALVVVVLTLDLALAAGVAVVPHASRGTRVRLAGGLGALAVTNTTACLSPHLSWVAAVAVTLVQVTAATVLLVLSAGLLVASLRVSRASIRTLREQLLRVEAGKRSDQARLHEIRATIGGIAHAAELIHEHGPLAPDWHARISQMMTSELGRLDRLLKPSEPAEVAGVDLDETLTPLVTRLLSQDRCVSVLLAEKRVIGCADDIAEIVNILLENAVRHGGDSEVRLRSERVGDSVEITVSDAGPGVSPELADHVFEWGVHGPSSTGDGVGLHVARALSINAGGGLELRSGRCGATFVLTLPAVPSGVR